MFITIKKNGVDVDGLGAIGAGGLGIDVIIELTQFLVILVNLKMFQDMLDILGGYQLIWNLKDHKKKFNL
jgi:hypothetical protein